MCTSIVSKIEELLKSGTVESEIATLVAVLCEKFPAPISTLCAGLVEKYVPSIIQWIEQGMEHANICAKLGFCSNEHLNADNGISCTICKSVVAEIEKIMVDTKVESEIIALLDKLCAKLPQPYSTVCLSLVEQYLPKIMQWLEEGIDHLEICKRIGLCPTDKVARLSNGIGCTICKSIVAEVEKVMVDTKVESEVIALIQELCNKLPAPASTICDALVADFVPQIMEWLEQGLDHLEICQKLGLCSNDTLFLGARVPRELESELTCKVCKDFFQWAEQELKTISVDALWKLVTVECPKVPYLREFCKIINEQNIETFVNLILAKFNPDEACKFIKLC